MIIYSVVALVFAPFLRCSFFVMTESFGSIRPCSLGGLALALAWRSGNSGTMGFAAASFKHVPCVIVAAAAYCNLMRSSATSAELDSPSDCTGP